nr:hypothetical protein [Prevotella pallens]
MHRHQRQRRQRRTLRGRHVATDIGARAQLRLITKGYTVCHLQAWWLRRLVAVDRTVWHATAHR